MRKKVYFIGVGMGNLNTLTLGALKALESCSRIIGAKRMLECFPDLHCEKAEAVSPEKIAALVKSCSGTAAVVFSGDIGFYSGAKRLYAFLEDYQVETICGVSSVVYFCSQLHTAWEDAFLVSTHGRDCNVVSAVRNHSKTFFLTGGLWKAEKICQALTKSGLGMVKVSVGENLSYPEERIVTAAAEKLCNEMFENLSVMLVENPQPFLAEYAVAGLEDHCFIRSNQDGPMVPMTKSEVRAVSLSKLRLKENSMVYDVGAGTGSVSMEAALRAKNGFVWAIEKKEAAVSLLKENQKNFGLTNLSVVQGEAPQALEPLPVPDCAFIGGSSGNMGQILELLLHKNPKIRVVVNAIALETLCETLDAFGRLGFVETEVVQLTVAKAKNVGGYRMMTGQNPVYILSGSGGGESHE